MIYMFSVPLFSLFVSDWDKNLSLLNKQFFSKLAIAMKSKQRLVLYAAYAKLQEMYKEVTRIYKERQGIPSEKNLPLSLLL